MQVSLDFARALAEIREEVKSLKKENETLRSELQEVRKMASSANDRAITQRKRTTQQAVLEGNKDRMRELSASSTDLAEHELLRMSTAEPVQFQPLQGVNQELLQGMLNAYEAGSLKPVAVTVEVNEPPSNVHKLYQQMRRNQSASKQMALAKQQMQEHMRLMAAKAAKENDGMKLGSRSERWAGPFD